MGESRDRVLGEARPRGPDWRTPKSKTISSDEKQTGVGGAGKGGGRMARAQGKFWGAGQAVYLIMVTDTQVHLPAFVKIHPPVPFKRAHSILCKPDLGKPKF